LDAEAGSATLDASSFNSLVPLRAAKFEVGGTTAYITQSVSGEMSIEASQVEIGIANGTTNFAVTGSTVKFGNLSAEYGFEIPGMPGNDTFFFVSGSTGSRNSSTKGTAVVGGDLVVSGGMVINAAQETATNGFTVYGGSNGSTSAISVSDSATSLNAQGATSRVVLTSLGSGNDAIRINSSGGVDIDADGEKPVNIAGGTVTLETNGDGTIPQQITLNTNVETDDLITIQNQAGTSASAIKINASAGGIDIDAATGIDVNTTDLVITGSVEISANNDLISPAFSGSLTHLSDGTSYLIAGTDIAITTGSNGAVTIASTAGGTPSAPDTSVQFNNGGSFGGNSDFIFDDANSRLFTKHIAVNEYVTASLFTQYVGDAFQFVGDGGAENNATDIAFYVSGSQGKAYGTAADVAVFGGDLIVSGGIYGGVSQSGDEEVSIFADHVSIGITEPGADTFLHVSGAIGGLQSGNGVTVFGGDVVSSGSIQVEEYFIGSLHQQFSGEAFQFLGAGASEITATDVAFYVSGAQGKAFGQAADVAVFGGDLVVSGGLYGGESDFGGTELSLFAESISLGETEPGQDTFLYVSGAAGGKQTGDGVAVFGGDVVFSGTIFNPGMQADTGGSAVKFGSFNELFYETSDVRIKTDINTIDAGLHKVQNLRGVTFRNSQREDSETEVGLIAQEVQAVVPEIVTTTPSGYLQVDYAKMVAVLIEAVKEQQSTIQLLESRILALEEK
jgi:hypothetical protein